MDSNYSVSRFHSVQSFVETRRHSFQKGIRSRFQKLLSRLGCGPVKRPDNRTIYISNHKTSDLLLPDAQVQEHFVNNTVITSKYTLWNFLPKNLFEQFKRVANFYFFCVGIITLSLKDETPVNPFTSILPLLFVISVTAVKQGYEDWRRHKSDREVNLNKAYVIREGKVIEVRSQEIKVGDLVRVMVNHSFPCDMLLISSSDENGSCYVTTANLDGETNLKKFNSLLATQQYVSVELLNQLHGVIQCEQPISDLYRFTGRLIIDNKPYSLGPENILLRGSRLRDTTQIFGCAIYTGQETKMALNSKFKCAKFSRVEKAMNKYLIVCLVFLLIECGLSVGLKYGYMNHPDFSKISYLPNSTSSNDVISVRSVIINLLSFLILYNYIIPISLYVTIEVQKFVGSMFFSWDLSMYDPSTGPAKTNTSDLNEELGQVEHLFSDKTGTLTENDMIFRQCFVAGKSYIDVNEQLYLKDSDKAKTPVSSLSKDLFDFFLVLCICHSCHIEKGMNVSIQNFQDTMPDGDAYIYQASSPDEKAFLEASRRYGVIYHGVFNNLTHVSHGERLYKFSVLHVLEFDSSRKRMSVIVRDGDGVIQLLCKGAESALYDQIKGEFKQETYEKIDTYARLGLRTLVIAKRILTKEEYTKVDFMISQASTSLTHRSEMMARTLNRIERKLTLLGATAVEDRLQDDVPHTIASLTAAGIKVWVLTGDKEETAVNISYSAGHFSPGVVELRVTKMTTSEDAGKLLNTLSDQLEANKDLSISYVLVVDGYTLTFLLNDHRNLLRKVSSFCSSVLCCRLSPIQKAEVVRLIKLSDESPVTAAIGDGANDVSMIQEAHVGLGLFGKEGRQAARGSDYAFAKFRFIKRALLFHGHYFYYRLAIMVQYFFYKNVAFVTAQFYYTFFSAYSQQTLYDSFLLSFYNLTFTSLPIFIFGLFEQHLPQASLMCKPALYTRIKRNELLKWKNFILWVTLGFYHSLVCYFGLYLLVWTDVSIFSSGKSIDNFSFGGMVNTVCVFIVNAKLAVETFNWCVPMFISYLITIGGYFLLIFFHGLIIWPILFGNELFGSFLQLFSSVTLWLAFLVLLFAALLPDLVIKVFTNRKILRKSADMAVIASKKERESVEIVSMDEKVAKYEVFSQSAVPHTGDLRQPECSINATNESSFSNAGFECETA